MLKYMPVITTFLAVAGFILGFYQYTHQQRLNRAAAEREFMKPWLESQRRIYESALSATARIANPVDEAGRKAATAEFWQLYQGEMILVETKSVSGAMVDFGNCLKTGAACTAEDMNDLTRKLGTAMAESMARTAKKTYAEFAQDQFRYD